MSKIIVEHHFATAEELLTTLSPFHCRRASESA